MTVKVLNGIDKIRSQAGTDLTIDDSVAEQARLETDKLDKAGGTITGNLSISGTLTNTALTASIASKLDSSTTPTPTGSNDVLKWDGSNFINAALSSTGMTTTGFVNPATTSGPSDVLQWDGSALVNVSGFATETSVIGKMPSNVSLSTEVVQWDGSNLVNVSGFVQDSDILNKMPSTSTPLGSVVTWDGSRLQNTTGMAPLAYVQSLRPAAASTSNEVVKWNGTAFENAALSTTGFTTTGFITPATTSSSTDVLQWDGSNFINVSGFAQIGTASTLTDLGLIETAVNAKAEAPPTQSTTGTYLYHDGVSWQYGTPSGGGSSFGTPSSGTLANEAVTWDGVSSFVNTTGYAMLTDISTKVDKPSVSTASGEVLKWNQSTGALENVALSTTGFTSTGSITPPTNSAAGEYLAWDGTNGVFVNRTGFVTDSLLDGMFPLASENTSNRAVLIWNGTKTLNKDFAPATATPNGEFVRWNGTTFENVALSTTGMTTTGFVNPASGSGFTEALQWDATNSIFVNTPNFRPDSSIDTSASADDVLGWDGTQFYKKTLASTSTAAGVMELTHDTVNNEYVLSVKASAIAAL